MESKKAKIFSWVYDIDSITLETDSSSTLVVMKQNANSPSVSVNAWTDFYMGFSNIEEFVTNQQHLNYRVGMYRDHKIRIIVQTLLVTDVGDKI